jgi:transcriptional regulator with XRE-family HTH domain
MNAKPYQELRDKLFTPEEQAASDVEAQRIVFEATLQQLRKALGLTQAQVAKALRVSQAQISKYETASDMMLSRLRCMLEAMGCELRILARPRGHEDWVELEALEKSGDD